MNDLPSVIKTCDFNLYADDMEMHCSNVNLSCAEHDLQDDLNSVYSWLCINLLSLNVPKSNVMLVGSRQKLQNRDLKLLLMKGHYLVSLHSSTLGCLLMKV